MSNINKLDNGDIRTARIEMRVTPEQKRHIEKEAHRLTGGNVTRYLLMSSDNYKSRSFSSDTNFVDALNEMISLWTIGLANPAIDPKFRLDVVDQLVFMINAYLEVIDARN